MDFSYLAPADQRLRGDWQLAEVQGRESMAWVCEDFVLQARPVTLMDNIKKSLEILKPLLEQPEFRSANGEIIAGKDLVFYILWPRVRGEKLLFPRDGLFPDWEKLEPLLPSLARALQKLHTLPVEANAYSFPKNPIISSRIASRDWILSSLEAKVGVRVHLPDEPKSEMVISHGDLALHNMFYSDGQVFLFDWSNLSALPRDADAAHFVQSIIAGLDPGAWPDILRATHLLAPYLSLQDWVAAVLWSLARSAAIWTAYHPAREGFLAEQEKIEALLAEF